MAEKEPGQSESIDASLKQVLALETWNLLNKKLEFKLSSESRENLQLLNSILAENSAVLYINHTSKMDVLVTILLILSHLPNVTRMMGPAGMKHYDWRRDPLSALFLRSLKVLNIHALPVVQVDDTRDYGPKKMKMLTDLKNQTTELLAIPGTVYGIAPEGTRNRTDGRLQKANRGIGYLERYAPDVFYTPLSITYEKFSDQPELVVGIPLQLADIIPSAITLPSNSPERAQTIADYHMHRLARLMPENLQGVYNLI